jgi:hypothetical protein
VELHIIESIRQARARNDPADQIAKTLGISRSTYFRRLKEIGEPRRPTQCDRLTPITKFQHEVIEGDLLGDGGIYKPRATPYFYHGSQDQEFTEHLKSVLPFDWKKDFIQPPGPRMIRGAVSQSKKGLWRISTLADLTLMNYWERWYSPKGVKHLPADFRVTPTTLRYFFYGDGTSSPHGNGLVEVALCVEGFTQDDAQSLKAKLQAEGLVFGTKRSGKGFRLRCSRIDHVHAFFDYIGKCELRCFDHKWKRPDSASGENRTGKHQRRYGSLEGEKPTVSFIMLLLRQNPNLSDQKLATLLSEAGHVNRFGNVRWQASQVRKILENYLRETPVATGSEIGCRKRIAAAAGYAGAREGAD